MNTKQNPIHAIPIALNTIAKTNAQICTVSMTITVMPSLGTPTNQKRIQYHYLHPISIEPTYMATSNFLEGQHSNYLVRT